MTPPKTDRLHQPHPVDSPSSSTTNPSSSDRAQPPIKTVAFRRDSHSTVRTSTEVTNEQSPLLVARSSEDGSSLKVVSPLRDDDWQTGQYEQSKSSWYLLLLTLTGVGLQMSWSVEMAYGSPYLLSLGVSKSFLALVWIAAPLSGVIVQPYVGMVSDRSRSRFGKRRPFIVGGAFATLVSLLLLSWARELVGGFLAIFGAKPESGGVKNSIIMFAVVMIYVLDFAINTMQAGIRAFVADCAPTHQQEEANAWIARSSGMGNIIGYLAGFVNLPKYLPWLGYSQFKVLSAITCFALALSVTISCASVHERDARAEGSSNADESVAAFFRSLIKSFGRLPKQVVRVCQVQCAAWIGWFPFLFYTTTYLGEVYADPFFKENPNMTEEEIDRLMEKATRVATLALFIFALTTFAASVFLPFIITPTFQPPERTVPTPLTPNTPNSLSNSQNSSYFAATERKSKIKSMAQRVHDLLSHLRIRSLTIRRAWMFSHVLFAIAMWLTIFVRTVTAATVLIALIGIPWALTQWAPFALISAEVSKRDAIRRGLIRAPPTRDGQLLAHGEDDTADQAGVVLGIHNVAISAPQVLATLISSGIFKALQKPRGSPDDHSVEWVLRFGGTCALLAAYLTTRVFDGDEDLKVDSERVD
ncbi:hypothetical protein EJ05DRAFT_539773 [Pseudovirgaria hyperparasitica]|uniref:MFS general substrate transporter n=1 Tax=Pseudovirgaria hyperparasitica TaxID=470096 RepID=A0A6A6VZ24_9PEZI|nr:uncharacterized protein EJ05DRAFT_539773 [Pseudovirgaria hyperparasitica]KAF2755928.1 hypothetical protein EJ05DRAFT_539773 [Pseudovirgaria hyperparasitica]